MLGVEAHSGRRHAGHAVQRLNLLRTAGGMVGVDLGQRRRAIDPIFTVLQSLDEQREGAVDHRAQRVGKPVLATACLQSQPDVTFFAHPQPLTLQSDSVPGTLVGCPGMGRCQAARGRARKRQGGQQRSAETARVNARAPCGRGRNGR